MVFPWKSQDLKGLGRPGFPPSLLPEAEGSTLLTQGISQGLKPLLTAPRRSSPTSAQWDLGESSWSLCAIICFLLPNSWNRGTSRVLLTQPLSSSRSPWAPPVLSSELFWDADPPLLTSRKGLNSSLTWNWPSSPSRNAHSHL